MEDVLTLYTSAREQDEYGVWRLNSTPRTVFCEVRSISRQEFFEAGRSGLNPAFEFLVFRGDYDGESRCSFRGQGYAIYRTYLPEGSDYIELYAERQGGTNG